MFHEKKSYVIVLSDGLLFMENGEMESYLWRMEKLHFIYASEGIQIYNIFPRETFSERYILTGGSQCVRWEDHLF